MRRIGDTSDEATILAKGALLELFERFPKLRDQSAVGGGIAVSEWVSRPLGIGPLNTADVDLLLDNIHVEADYPTLKKELLGNGLYEQRRDRKDPTKFIQFSFIRKGSAPQRIQIDFQGPEVTGVPPTPDRLQLAQVGDLPACVLLGGRLALGNSETKQLIGRTLEGKQLKGDVKLVKPFILVPQKLLAFMNRGLPTVDLEFRTVKDAADLYALLKSLGPDALSKSAKGYHGRTLFANAREALRRHFSAEGGRGGEGVDALVEFTAGRLPEAQLRSEMVDLARTYLKGIGG